MDGVPGVTAKPPRRADDREGREAGGDADGLGVDPGLVEHDIHVCEHRVAEERHGRRERRLGLDVGGLLDGRRLRARVLPTPDDEQRDERRARHRRRRA